MYQSILNYKNKRYLKFSVLIGIIAIAGYVFHDPIDPPNGGTFYGYTVGTVAALIILWLTWFGYRKRQYAKSGSMVQGWLSAHIYLGICLLLLASLHSAMQFGWNIHSLAYVLMCIVIFSGIYGLYVYLKYPSYLVRNREQDTRENFLKKLNKIDRECVSQLTKTEPSVREAVTSAIQRTVLSGSRLSLLFSSDQSMVFLPDDHGSVLKSGLQKNAGQQLIIDYLSDKYARSKGGDETIVLLKLLELFADRKRVLEILRGDLRLQAILQSWLYIHVPLTFALLAALLSHILTVFIYW